jgi:hypothetical protein
MALLAEYGARVPMDSAQRPYKWNRAVKIFEGNNMTTVEAQINAFIVTLANTFDYAAIIGYTALPNGAGNNARVLLDYGWFTPVP